MSADENTEGAVFDTRADAGTGEAGLVRLWIEALDLSGKTEEDWRKRAQAAVDIYRDDSKDREQKRFNILYSNTETLGPALYNSVPIPDVRPRYMATDANDPRVALSKQVSQVLERALSYTIDAYDFDDVMKAAVKDRLLPGRAVSRVRYEPTMGADGNVAYEAATCEPVEWQDFRIGPARVWTKTPWIAFRHYLTREQTIALNPQIGATIPLDSRVDGKNEDKDDNRAPDVFKRLMVWEIWDKEKREILFIAPSYKNAPLKKEKDTLDLEQFFPVPRPMLAIETTDTQTPIEPFRQYKDQADELDLITRRITALTKVLKARGIYASPMSDAFEQLSNKADGEYVPSDNTEMFMQAGGLDNAIWQWPLEVISVVIERLYLARDQIKAVIFEITGVADVMRGQTDAGETLGAQQLKAQWGSLRLQEQQRDVQRYARDVLRLQAEIIANKFSAQTLTMMTGIEVTPDVEAVLRNDLMRSFSVDIETNSTIQADVAQAQQNGSQFLQGLGAYFQAVGPAVQTGAMPPNVSIKLLMGLARPFKLGKQAEDAMDEWERETTQKIEQAKANPPPPPPPDPKVISAQIGLETTKIKAGAEQAKTQAEMQKTAAETQAAQQMGALDAQALQMDAVYRQQEHDFKMKELVASHNAKMAQIEAQAKAAKERPKADA